MPPQKVNEIVLEVYQIKVSSVQKQLEIEQETVKRRNRDTFKGLLERLTKEGRITDTSKWSQLLPIVTNTEEYIYLKAQQGMETVQNVFNEHMLSTFGVDEVFSFSFSFSLFFSFLLFLFSNFLISFLFIFSSQKTKKKLSEKTEDEEGEILE